jgi:threonine dehydratase
LPFQTPGEAEDLTDIKEPTIKDVFAARRVISPHILRTPLRRYPGLSELLDADVWVKHENMQVMGSFKPRGGLNLIGRSSPEQRERGFITASSGNHGQSVAFAAMTFGSHATIVVPENGNPVKIAAMEGVGAKVIKHGAYYDHSSKHAMSLAEETGMELVHAINDPRLYAGVGTYALEIHEDLDDIESIIVPVGGGSGAGGTCIVNDALSPDTEVIGVQAGEASAVQQAWLTGKLEDKPMGTRAEGLATGSAQAFPISILRKRLKRFELVSEAGMEQAVELFLRHTRTLVEHSGAATLAAAVNMKAELKGKRIVLIASGANVTVEQLAGIIGKA